MEEKEKSTYSWIILILIIFFIFGLFLNFSDFETESNTKTTGVAITSDGAKQIKNTNFTVLKDKTSGTRSKDGLYTIKGQLKQNIEGSYTGLFVTFNLLDKNNKKVRETTGIQFTKYLGNNIWEFEVSGNDADNIVKNYELISCYGY